MPDLPAWDCCSLRFSSLAGLGMNPTSHPSLTTRPIHQSLLNFYNDKQYTHISTWLGGSGGRAVERRTVNRGDGGLIPSAAVSKLRQFRSPHIVIHSTVFFGRDTKSWWSLLSGVYARGSNKSHTGGKCVTCSGLTNSREEQLLS